MFFSSEYRRGLIRTTLAATPSRGAVLAAKAAVIGAVAFVTGLVAAVVSIAVGVPKEEHSGQVLLTAPLLTEVRVIVGTAAMLALAAVFAVALGAILRRSAAAITIAVVIVVMPFLLTALDVVPAGVGDWLLRLTPAAGLAIEQSIPRYPQVTTITSPVRGTTAVALRRVRRAVPVGGGGPCPRAGHAAAAGRMSAAVQTQPAATMATAAARGASLRHALHAEWTKLRTVSGPAWLLARGRGADHSGQHRGRGATHCPENLTCPVDTTKLSLTGVQFGQAVVAILAVLAFCNEYSTGMIRVTLAAMPRRHTVFAAKAILIASLVLVAGAVAVFGSVLAGHLILPGHGFTAARGFHRCG